MNCVFVRDLSGKRSGDVNANPGASALRGRSLRRMVTGEKPEISLESLIIVFGLRLVVG